MSPASNKPPRGKNNLQAWLSWQENAHPKKWDLGLSRISKVWQALGSPRIAKKVITVAGTNGKGSCVAWAEAISQAHHFSYGSFTSPHLLDYCERIRFQSEKITPALLCASFDAIDDARGDISLTYFEWSALAAFYAMSQKDLDFAFLEVGLGGRLDAVNLIDANAVIFTEIGIDHQDWLGETLDEIAGEKAGVLREHQLVSFADANPPQVIRDKVSQYKCTTFENNVNFKLIKENNNFELHFQTQSFRLNYPSILQGDHQLLHCAAVCAILNHYYPLDNGLLNKALASANNLGRLTTLSTEPNILIDVAHNPDSATVLKSYLQSLASIKKIIVICGMLKDKDQQGVFRIMKSVVSTWHFISLPGERGACAELLKENAEYAGIERNQLFIYPNIEKAYADALSHYNNSDLIVIMGSFLTVTLFLTTWGKYE